MTPPPPPPPPQSRILYFLALVYCLFGVTIIADKFMVAIEVITSKETSVGCSFPARLRSSYSR